MDIPNKGVKSIPRDSVVSSWADLGGKAIVQDDLADNLSENGDAKDHPRDLEAPSENIKESSHEDQGHDSQVSNAGGT